jgi:hypothetical protein
MFAVPLAWGILLLFHPRGDGDFFPIVTDHVLRWQAVHLGTMILLPMLAGVVFLLLRGLDDRASTVGRIAIAVFAVAYTAWEVLVGVGTGILVNEVNQLSGGAATTGENLVESYNQSTVLMTMLVIGGLGLSVGLIATGYALKAEPGASRWIFPLLLLSAFPIGFHEPPVGPIGLALFGAVVFLVTRNANRETHVSDLRAPSAAPANPPA